jgi:hypothetical protein
MTTPTNSSIPPANAETTETAPAAPEPSPKPILLHVIATQPPRSLPLAAVGRALFALAYPLALLGAVTFLFVRIGPSGWLFVVILAAALLALVAPKLPGSDS